MATPAGWSTGTSTQGVGYSFGQMPGDGTNEFPAPHHIERGPCIDAICDCPAGPL